MKVSLGFLEHILQDIILMEVDRELYKELVCIKGIRAALCSYVNWIYRNSDKTIIDEAKSISKNYDDSNELYVDILKNRVLKFK